jgi:hypothetical protein
MLKGQLLQLFIRFRAIGFYNEADTLESSSILIYSQFSQSLYTWKDWQDAELIKVI